MPVTSTTSLPVAITGTTLAFVWSIIGVYTICILLENKQNPALKARFMVTTSLCVGSFFLLSIHAAVNLWLFDRFGYDSQFAEESRRLNVRLLVFPFACLFFRLIGFAAASKAQELRLTDANSFPKKLEVATPSCWERALFVVSRNLKKIEAIILLVYVGITFTPTFYLSFTVWLIGMIIAFIVAYNRSDPYYLKRESMFEMIIIIVGFVPVAMLRPIDRGGLLGIVLSFSIALFISFYPIYLVKKSFYDEANAPRLEGLAGFLSGRNRRESYDLFQQYCASLYCVELLSFAGAVGIYRRRALEEAGDDATVPVPRPLMESLHAFDDEEDSNSGSKLVSHEDIILKTVKQFREELTEHRSELPHHFLFVEFDFLDELFGDQSAEEIGKYIFDLYISENARDQVNLAWERRVNIEKKMKDLGKEKNPFIFYEALQETWWYLRTSFDTGFKLTPTYRDYVSANE